MCAVLSVVRVVEASPVAAQQGFHPRKKEIMASRENQPLQSCMLQVACCMNVRCNMHEMHRQVGTYVGTK